MVSSSWLFLFSLLLFLKEKKQKNLLFHAGLYSAMNAIFSTHFFRPFLFMKKGRKKNLFFMPIRILQPMRILLLTFL
jgi:hypothetical protein